MRSIKEDHMNSGVVIPSETSLGNLARSPYKGGGGGKELVFVIYSETVEVKREKKEMVERKDWRDGAVEKALVNMKTGVWIPKTHTKARHRWWQPAVSAHGR